MTSTARDVARRRIAARPARDRIAWHQQAGCSIAVSGLAALDLGVYRVDRADGPAWVARVFPAVRAESAAAGDAEILGFLQRHGFPSDGPRPPSRCRSSTATRYWSPSSFPMYPEPSGLSRSAVVAACAGWVSCGLSCTRCLLPMARQPGRVVPGTT